MPGKTMDAATVVLLRDSPGGPELLMLRRDSRIAFAGGHWVFPGGRVDDTDRVGAPDELAAARHAAVRETQEEAGLTLRGEDLVPFSHWTPPDIAPKRYLTWFFLAAAPAEPVRIDEHEIRDHAWMRPRDALERRNAGQIELGPPTWITLEQLAPFASVDETLRTTRVQSPERFATRISVVDGGAVALYHGDEGYETSDASVTGRRHRLWMMGDGWRYERD
jgi:8-oxo-dGTP pyrophosphatase MutT (NUDIX family)